MTKRNILFILTSLFIFSVTAQAFEDAYDDRSIKIFSCQDENQNNLNLNITLLDFTKSASLEVRKLTSAYSSKRIDSLSAKYEKNCQSHDRDGNSSCIYKIVQNNNVLGSIGVYTNSTSEETLTRLNLLINDVNYQGFCK